MDGCYSNNLPTLDNRTITVSPFCGEADICPRDRTLSLMVVSSRDTEQRGNALSRSSLVPSSLPLGH